MLGAQYRPFQVPKSMNGKVWYKTAALERSAARSRMGYAPVAGFEKLGEDRYVANVTRHALRVLAIIGLQIQSGLTEAKSHETVAISATATGNDQWVGFRALVMKQAIAYNLAGTAKNNPNNVVEFTLQGRSKRIDKAVETIRNGTRKSSNIEVKTAPVTVDPKLDTFRVVDWTSTTRQITTPYTLVFRLRDTDETVSKSEAKDVWHEILKTTLLGDDLKKLGDDD